MSLNAWWIGEYCKTHFPFSELFSGLQQFWGHLTESQRCAAWAASCLCSPTIAEMRFHKLEDTIILHCVCIGGFLVSLLQEQKAWALCIFASPELRTSRALQQYWLRKWLSVNLKYRGQPCPHPQQPLRGIPGRCQKPLINQIAQLRTQSSCRYCSLQSLRWAL